MSTLRIFRTKADDHGFFGKLGFYFLLFFGTLISVFPLYWIFAVGTNGKGAEFHVPELLSAEDQFVHNFKLVLEKDDFIWPLYILKNKELYTIQNALQQFFTTRDGLDYGMIISATFMAALPLLIVFLLFSCWVIAGLTSGATKS